MSPVDTLLAKGVLIPAPETVFIGPEVNPDRIEAGTVIHAGCRLYGKDLYIGAGCELGAEAPLTLKQSQLGRKVKLAGGYVEKSVFLDGANGASGAHIRPGCIFEEEASFAHTVGMKQTIFLPFVTAGSLINFCDALMAGGTSRKDHSEIGSSYIHFNYTPHQDKATASLVGDVPRGVLLNERAIFLGGQGGMVGPLKIEYGTIIGAGVVQRKDVLKPNHLVISAAPPAMALEFDPKVYGNVGRVVTRNLEYLGNLYALEIWYRNVRRAFLPEPLYAGALARLADAFDERMKRLGEFAAKVAVSAGITGNEHQTAFAAAWPELKVRLEALLAARDAVAFPEPAAGLLPKPGQGDYLAAVKALDEAARTEISGRMDAFVALFRDAF